MRVPFHLLLAQSVTFSPKAAASIERRASPKPGHHVNGYSVFMAGGGFKGGVSYGETDEFGNGVAANPVDIHDIHATILHQMGLDHERLTYRYSGRDFRLTDVHGKVVKALLA